MLHFLLRLLIYQGLWAIGELTVINLVKYCGLFIIDSYLLFYFDSGNIASLLR